MFILLVDLYPQFAMDILSDLRLSVHGSFYLYLLSLALTRQFCIIPTDHTDSYYTLGFCGTTIIPECFGPYGRVTYTFFVFSVQPQHTYHLSGFLQSNALGVQLKLYQPLLHTTAATMLCLTVVNVNTSSDKPN